MYWDWARGKPRFPKREQGGGGTVHWMEDNFVQFFLGLIQLFLNHYQRLDTYIWYFVRYVSLALIYSPKTMNFCKQGAKNLKKIVFW